MLDFSCIFNVTFPLEFYLKFNSLSNALYFRALAPILTELWPFSRGNFLKHDFFGFFSSCRPPLQESDHRDQPILLFVQQGVDVYFQKTTENCTCVPFKVLKMIEVQPYPLMSPYGVARGQWVNQSRVDFQKALKTPLIIPIRLIIHVEVIKTPSPMYSFTLFNSLAPGRIVK